MQLLFLAIFSLFIHLLTFLFGHLDTLFFSVLLLYWIGFCSLLFLDYKNKSFSWRTIFLRIFKIFGYLFLIIIAVILDQLLTHTDFIRNVVLMTLIFNEILVILKVLIRLGIQIPSILVSSLQKMLDTLPKEIVSSKEEKKN